MSRIRELEKFKTVLENPRRSSFFMSIIRPSIVGQFKGYSAEFGVRNSPGEEGIVFYSVLLKKKLKLSPALFGYALSHGMGIYNNKCLAMSYCVNREILGVKKYLDKQTVESVKQKFDKLVEAAQKIERGEIDLKNVVKSNRKRWFDLLPIFILLIFLYVVIWYFRN